MMQDTQFLDNVLPEPLPSNPIIRMTDIVGNYFTVSMVVPDTLAATAANYGAFFMAPFSCEIIEAWESHKTAGTGAGAVTLDIEKLTSSQALDAGVSTLTTTFNLKSTIDTPVRVKSNTTVIQRFLTSGDRLALKDSGTLTAVAQVTVTILIRPIQTQVNLSA